MAAEEAGCAGLKLFCEPDAMSTFHRLVLGIYGSLLNRVSFLRRQRFERTYRTRMGFGPLSYHEMIADDIVRRLPPGRYRKALDLGCGYGLIAKKLSVRVPEVTAVDISETALRLAKKGPSKVKFVRDDVVSFRRSQYDLILCVGILPYIPARYAQKVSENINQMLAPGGVLAIFEKQGYTGTRIEKVTRRLGWPAEQKNIRVAGMPFIMTVVRRGR